MRMDQVRVNENERILKMVEILPSEIPLLDLDETSLLHNEILRGRALQLIQKILQDLVIQTIQSTLSNL